MKRVGVLGGGQLGRMLALAGYPLGVQFKFYDPASDACASQIGECMCGDYENDSLLRRFAEKLDVITYEFENVPVRTVSKLSQSVPVLPPCHALEVSQDRFHEKSFLRECEIPTPDFAAIDSLDDLYRATDWSGYPAVLKTRRMGYDGKGQVILRSREDVGRIWQVSQFTPMILERYIAYDREMSILAVRGHSGEIASYPLVQNWHADGILRKSVPVHGALDRNADVLYQVALGYVTRILESLDYIGILALELFEINGQLMANEMAPRVHNSGHWTIEGAVTSQFENHLRTLLDLPLGSTRTVGYPAMLNIISSLPEVRAILQMPDVHLHLYGKEPRLGRKLGHITIMAQTPQERDSKISEVVEVLSSRALPN